MRKSCFILLFFAVCTELMAIVHLHFPHFAGKPYVFVLFQGDRTDTIVRSAIPLDGKVELTLPDYYKDYRGMSRWIITDANGGGLDMVIGNEDFSVECLDANPNQSNIIYTGSAENAYLNSQYFEQQQLFRKIDAMRLAVQSYDEKEPLSATFNNELKGLMLQYSGLREGLKSSPLYAAHFRRITDFLIGIGDKLPLDEHEKAVDLDEFFTRQMDIAALYTSHHWDGAIYNWFQMHLNVLKDDALLTNDIRQLFNRMPDNALYTEFAVKIVRFLTKWGKDAILADLCGDVKRSGRLTTTSGSLSVFTGVQKGDKAPELYELKGKDLTRTILLFHETGCGHCDSVVTTLSALYPSLAKQGVRVISVASDVDQALFKAYLPKLVWFDHFCDFKGPIGINFKNYGVVGTPTLFYIDKKGMVKGRFARVDDLIKLLTP